MTIWGTVLLGMAGACIGVAIGLGLTSYFDDERERKKIVITYIVSILISILIFLLPTFVLGII